MVGTYMEELSVHPERSMEKKNYIFLPEIIADHFEIKIEFLTTSSRLNQLHGYERENPHAHINSFKRITSTLRFRDVPNDDEEWNVRLLREHISATEAEMVLQIPISRTDKTKITRKPSKTGKHRHDNGRAQKKPGNQAKKVKALSQTTKGQRSKVTNLVPQSYTSSYLPPWSITSKNDTLAGVEAQRMMGFVLKALTIEAQMSQSWIATLAIRVSS
ncbi:hypothetical protein Tco_0403598 [Tanacetum coccineum]